MDTKVIRQELKKELNYNARQVSVKSELGGYSYSFIFTIRDKNVNYDKVNEFAHKYKSVSRCEYSGEILAGGNTYITVRFSDKLKEEMENKHFPKLKEWVDNVDKNNSIVFDDIEVVYHTELNEIRTYNRKTNDMDRFYTSNEVSDWTLKDISFYIAQVTAK
jgi:hypothetical protein